MNRRGELLAIIRKELEAGRLFPTRQALADRIGWKNESSVNDALWALVKDGELVATQSGRRFTFSLPPKEDLPRPAAPGIEKGD